MTTKPPCVSSQFQIILSPRRAQTIPTTLLASWSHAFLEQRFDPFGWHLKNAETSIFVGIFVGFIDMWSMPLFFLISGVATWYGLGARTGGQYLFERVRRLLVPMFTVGIFFLLPPQYFFEITTNRGFTGSFWESYALYFADIFIDNGPLAFFCTFWAVEVYGEAVGTPVAFRAPSVQLLQHMVMSPP